MRRSLILNRVSNITIVPEPPNSNGPRYPLYIAEIDEEKVAVRREGLMLVDDRREGDSERLQLSNFSVIENRETLAIEIYLTRIGEHADHFWQGAVYRYVFSPPV